MSLVTGTLTKEEKTPMFMGYICTSKSTGVLRNTVDILKLTTKVTLFTGSVFLREGETLYWVKSDSQSLEIGFIGPKKVEIKTREEDGWRFVDILMRGVFLSSGEEVFSYLATLNPEFPWLTHISIM